ncbi:PREDICTED: metallophosphoesterase 1-like [Lupinus angustifolius]|uniref:metallophosphoesterase 1-like n=1 Tax=Lupinus angustifolius TaxID=3871 RepID=UPI00092F85F7|nr:PREDICTED: metallophosphoesterase 1-like [Lupinus angustifolius]
MVIGLRALSLIAIASLLVFEEWVSTPTCKLIPNKTLHFPQFHDHDDDNSDEFKVMMVAELLLLGSEAGYVNQFFRDYYMSKFFRKSFESLKPDLLLVLGDVSAKGSKLTKSKWTSVLRQFHTMLGPFVGLPFHAVLGDRDIGECSDLDANKVNWISHKLPGLDHSGCGAFEIGNISFVTLNAVALLCGNSSLRFDIEKAIERESLELHVGMADTKAAINNSTNFGDADYNFGWRESTVLPGSGPVLLLHFPLDQTRNEHYDGIDAIKRSSNTLIDGLNVVPKSRELIGAGLYKSLHTLPLNASEYILQALKPRIIFSAHRYAFSDHIHLDKTREISVPAMSWNARDDPGFVIATFHKTRREVSISYCSLARESHICIVYISMMVLFCFVCLKA